MARVPQFTERARRSEPPAAVAATGAPEALLAAAKAAGQVADRIGRMADRAAAAEGARAGLAHGLDAPLPGPGGAGAASLPADGSAGAAIAAAAAELGIDPLDLATVISYETGGTFSPSIRGGRDNAHVGLIQFGPEEQKRYGVRQDQGVAEQMPAVVAYLRDRGVRPGMGLLDLYSTVNAGRPGRYTASDRPGFTVARHVTEMQGAHRDRAAALLGRVASGQLAVVPAAAREAPAFTLTGGGTIRGRAFDRGAVATYADRLAVQTAAEMEALAQQHRDDPAALAQALDAWGRGVASEIPRETPEVRAEFEAAFARNRLALVRAAGRAFEARRRDEALAAFEDAWTARRTNLVRLARRAGAGEDADEAIAGEMAAIERQLEGSGLKATDQAELRRELVRDVTVARILAGFDAQGDPAARRAYADSVRAAWLEGSGDVKGLDPRAFDQVTAEMERAMARDEAELARQANATRQAIDRTMRTLEEGFPVPADTRAELRARAQGSGDPEIAARFGLFEALADWQAANVVRTPEEIAPQIDALERQMAAEGATPEGVQALKLMRGLHSRMVKALDDDPLGWAALARGMEIEPIDPANLEASLAVRQADAHAVAQLYGRPPRFFRPGEAAVLEARIAEDPDALTGLAVTLRQAFGDRDVPQALAELSRDAPVVAHAAGVALATGDDRVLRETAEALRLRALDGYTPPRMDPRERAAATRQILGPALFALPETEAAAIRQAELLFEAAARREGLEPGDDPRRDAELWATALDRALGANGDRGGIGEVNGHPTLVPPDMTADELQALVDSITAEDLEALPETASATDMPIRAGDIAGGALVAVGQGRYRVALGTPMSDDPRYVMTPGGDFWVLDVGVLRRRRGE